MFQRISRNAPSGDHHWRPVQNCSLQDSPIATGADIWGLLKHVRSSQASDMHFYLPQTKSGVIFS